jgi:hypothetical protein
MKQLDDTRPLKSLARRRFIAIAGTAALTATTAGLLAAGSALGAEAKPKPKTATSATPKTSTAQSLNRVLGLEWELVAAYAWFRRSGLLSTAATAYAENFLGHHQAHVERLSGAIKAAGGKPVPAKSDAAYIASLKLSALKSPQDIMKLALRLEKGAADAYLGMVASLPNLALAQVVARLGADNAMHWGVIADGLGTPMPQKAMSFGA